MPAAVRCNECEEVFVVSMHLIAPEFIGNMYCVYCGSQKSFSIREPCDSFKEAAITFLEEDIETPIFDD